MDIAKQIAIQAAAKANKRKNNVAPATVMEREEQPAPVVVVAEGKKKTIAGQSQSDFQAARAIVKNDLLKKLGNRVVVPSPSSKQKITTPKRSETRPQKGRWRHQPSAAKKKKPTNAAAYGDLTNPNVKPDNLVLPEGWECIWSNSQGKWYFWNAKTGESAWKPPPGWALEAAKKEAVTAATTTEPPLNFQQKMARLSQTTSGSSSSSSTDTGINQDEMVSKYKKMLKMGIPQGAVRNKMASQGVPYHVQEMVLSKDGDTKAPPSQTVAATATSNPFNQKVASPPPLLSEDEELASKYRKMLKMGIPEGAVRVKMGSEGVSSHVQESVLGGAPAAALTKPNPPASSRTATKAAVVQQQRMEQEEKKKEHEAERVRKARDAELRKRLEGQQVMMEEKAKQAADKAEKRRKQEEHDVLLVEKARQDAEAEEKKEAEKKRKQEKQEAMLVEEARKTSEAKAAIEVEKKQKQEEKVAMLAAQEAEKKRKRGEQEVMLAEKDKKAAEAKEAKEAAKKRKQEERENAKALGVKKAAEVKAAKEAKKKKRQEEQETMLAEKAKKAAEVKEAKEGAKKKKEEESVSQQEESPDSSEKNSVKKIKGWGFFGPKRSNEPNTVAVTEMNSTEPSLQIKEQVQVLQRQKDKVSCRIQVFDPKDGKDTAVVSEDDEVETIRRQKPGILVALRYAKKSVKADLASKKKEENESELERVDGEEPVWIQETPFPQEAEKERSTKKEKITIERKINLPVTEEEYLSIAKAKEQEMPPITENNKQGLKIHFEQEAESLEARANHIVQRALERQGFHEPVAEHWEEDYGQVRASYEEVKYTDEQFETSGSVGMPTTKEDNIETSKYLEEIVETDKNFEAVEQAEDVLQATQDCGINEGMMVPPEEDGAENGDNSEFEYLEEIVESGDEQLKDPQPVEVHDETARDFYSNGGILPEEKACKAPNDIKIGNNSLKKVNNEAPQNLLNPDIQESIGQMLPAPSSPNVQLLPSHSGRLATRTVDFTGVANEGILAPPEKEAPEKAFEAPLQKNDIATRLDQVLENAADSVVTQNSSELVPLTKKYQDFRKKLPTMVTAAKYYLEVTSQREQSRTTVSVCFSSFSNACNVHHLTILCFVRF